MNAVYLDYAATTPMRREVREAMAPFLDDAFGNPSSLHRWGREAAAALEEARSTAAEALGASASEILFTRGGTESDNLALLGRCRALIARGESPTLVISAIEHPAVLDAAQRAAERGEVHLVRLPVSGDGTLDVDPLRSALEAGPATVVSVMWVNNETGVLLPVPDVARIVEEHGGTLHTDAVQAIGKVPVSVADSPIHLLTATGHKIYGPKGTGLLFVRKGVELSPLLHGGGQERALRPGTEDVPGAVGLACALRLAVAERAQEAARLQALRDGLEHRLMGALPGLRINGGEANRGPHISSLGIEGVDGGALLPALDLDGIAVSGGSACASGTAKGSHVIAAMYGAQDARATVRISLGRSTTESETERAADTLSDLVARLRELEAVS